MASVLSRTKLIHKSRSNDPKVVNNYEQTVDRIDDAVRLLYAAQDNTRDSILVANNYRQAHQDEGNEWKKRVDLVNEVIKLGGLEAEFQLKPIIDIAEKMYANAVAQQALWNERMVQLGSSDNDMQRRVDELLDAKERLKVAQTLVDSRRKLEALASSIRVNTPQAESVAIPSPIETDELLKITALTREAEALAELKGWSV